MPYHALPVGHRNLNKSPTNSRYIPQVGGWGLQLIGALFGYIDWLNFGESTLIRQIRQLFPLYGMLKLCSINNIMLQKIL